VVLEEFVLSFQGIIHGLVALDILLGAVHHTNEAKFQRVHSAGQNVESIGAVVHQVELGEDADGPPAERIHMSGKLQSLRVDEIDIGR
jgi:hypothetical protein